MKHAYMTQYLLSTSMISLKFSERLGWLERMTTCGYQTSDDVDKDVVQSDHSRIVAQTIRRVMANFVVKACGG